jgi:uncharacterized protein (DUF885 family)
MIFRKILTIFASICALISSQLIQSNPSEFAMDEIAFHDTEKLTQIFESFFYEMQKMSPELATYVGKTKEFNGKWTDHSEEAYLGRYETLKVYYEKLLEVNKEMLSPEDRLNYDLFEIDLKNSLDGYFFQIHYMPVDQLGGIPLEVDSILMMMPTDTVQDYENVLSRLSRISIIIDQTIRLLQKGVQEGITPPQVALEKLPDCIEKMIPESLENSVFFQPFSNFSDEIDKFEQEKIKKQALQIIEKEIYPAYSILLTYLKSDYLPNCRQTIGASALPNGAAYYAYRIKTHTTTELSPEEIHQIGLNEVTRIQQEMLKILEEVAFSGTLSDYYEFLHTSPQFYYSEPEDLINGYKAITSYIDGQLSLLFNRMPLLPYEVVPVPAFAAEGQVGAYYMRGSLATGRPGRFFANTHDLKSRPKWQMESLSLHEAVPGHHFQISIAQEIEGLPEFRKYNNYTAYIEGWGLYSESLGSELGLYRSSENRFGRLIEEIWRAARLVIDTGMHALGWSREEAIAYMRETTGMGKREATTEVDRYIVWPGQALAYKVGELSFQRWRHEASEALGETFDIRAFHDMLLGQGALPLNICEEMVYRWIKDQKQFKFGVRRLVDALIMSDLSRIR